MHLSTCDHSVKLYTVCALTAKTWHWVHRIRVMILANNTIGWCSKIQPKFNCYCHLNIIFHHADIQYTLGLIWACKKVETTYSNYANFDTTAIIFYRAVVPNSVPGDLPPCRLSLQPEQSTHFSTARNLAELIISRIRCAKLGLKLKPSGWQISRNGVESPRSRAYIVLD